LINISAVSKQILQDFICMYNKKAPFRRFTIYFLLRNNLSYFKQTQFTGAEFSGSIFFTDRK
jgi:hypothetical protein